MHKKTAETADIAMTTSDVQKLTTVGIIAETKPINFQDTIHADKFLNATVRSNKIGMKVAEIDQSSATETASEVSEMDSANDVSGISDNSDLEVGRVTQRKAKSCDKQSLPLSEVIDTQELKGKRRECVDMFECETGSKAIDKFTHTSYL